MYLHYKRGVIKRMVKREDFARQIKGIEDSLEGISAMLKYLKEEMLNEA